MKKLIVLLLIFVLAIMYGCSNPSTPEFTDTIDIDELIKSPTIIQIDTTNYTLSVFLNRDFMPISPIDGKPMTAIVNIITTDSSAFPAHIDADKLWVIDSLDMWETNLVDNFIVDSLFQISKRATDGPKWKTGIFVDVVIRLVYNDSIYYYLKAENIIIGRTD